MILAWYDLPLLDYYQVIFFPFFTTILLNDTSQEIIDHDCHWGCPGLTWFNWIAFMTFVYLFINFVLVFTV